MQQCGTSIAGKPVQPGIGKTGHTACWEVPDGRYGSHTAIRYPCGPGGRHGGSGDSPEPPLHSRLLRESPDPKNSLAQEGFGVRSTRPLGPPFQTRLLVATRLE